MLVIVLFWNHFSNIHDTQFQSLDFYLDFI